jgi:uncharacterized protein
VIVAQCIPFVLRESHTLNVLQSRIHGLDHWWRVWTNAKMLAAHEPDVDLEVVALFALFHDSMRINDGDDPQHGLHGYKLWERFCIMKHLGQYMSIRQRETLMEACVDHNYGATSTDPTIGVCWDSDRLDLPRVGIWPDGQYMSTTAARELVITRTF